MNRIKDLQLWSLVGAQNVFFLLLLLVESVPAETSSYANLPRHQYELITRSALGLYGFLKYHTVRTVCVVGMRRSLLRADYDRPKQPGRPQQQKSSKKQETSNRTPTPESLTLAASPLMATA